MTNTPHSDTTTQGIRIQAAAQYRPRESEPAKGRYVFHYEITMTNRGDAPAKLLSRHWIIVDGDGQREDLHGDGVVGEFPKLGVGESYSYTSVCPLPTSWGTMEGSYTFERDDGSKFEVAIGRFFLVPKAPALSLETPSRG